MRSKDSRQLTDQVNIIIIELSKLENALKKPAAQLSLSEKWSLFLKYASDRMQRSLINDIIKEREEIAMAATILREISQDEHERARLRSRRMYETDMESNRITLIKIGKMQSDEEWKTVVADKDAEIAQLRSQIAEMQTR